jgi:hypothetical protein
MNCNLDRTPLTIKQLEDLARDCGTSEDEMERMHAVHDKTAFWVSWLLGITRQRRFEMCCHGELVLDSRQHILPIKPIPPIVIDPFFLNQAKTGATR